MVALLVLLPWLTRRDVALLTLGALYFAAHVAAVVDSRLDTRYEGDSQLVTVRVVGFAQHRPGATTFAVINTDRPRLPERMQLRWFEPPVALRPGDIWRLQLRLKRPRGSSNPGAPDFEAWMTRNRIGATGYVVDGRLNRLVDSGRRDPLERLRARYVERVDRDLGDRPSAAVVIALVVGSRHEITPGQWQRYAVTGTTHLMAISGLHVGLAAMFAYLVVAAASGAVGSRSDIHRRSLLAGALVACLYAAVSGFALPAQRAALMLVIGTIGLLALRQLDGIRVLATAALAVVISDPLATMAPGFALSFGAVLSLVWLARRAVAPAVNWRERAWLALRQLRDVQLGLAVALLPLTVLFFDRCSVASPLINAVAVPLFSVVTVPLALASLLLDGPLQGIGAAAMRAAAASVDWLEYLIAGAASATWSSHVIADLRGAAWLWLTVPVLYAVLPPRWPGRHTAWLACIALVSSRPAAPPADCVRVDVLDVGQGLAAVVQTATRVLVYDTGPAYRGASSAATRVLLPFLRHRGIDEVDALMLSHADLDHAGGTFDLLGGVRVGVVYAGEPLHALPAKRCVRDQAWSWDGVRFRVLHPPAGSPFDGNDASCVLQIGAGEHRVLLTGDIEAPVEAALVRARAVGTADVVAVPHHGSRTSSTPPFVSTVRARYAIVSAAHANQWGFPKPDVVARWRAAGARVLDTATSGSVGVRLCAATGIETVVENRRVRRRLWHDADSRGY
ncbi:MAG: DNA internalization-related competence protein ComEC/Rec2 [Woeseiaceae bacterium]|nr:DNA internalization-related competence protein ComEC/Rec2 [Woeseiaceae bacterium]